MTVTASIHVSESLQTLIDCRLDTIDRMLLGRLPRSERVEIVREVESQIFELLGERHSEELTREDVLRVLGTLDPPEAYLPDETSCESSPRRGVPSTLPRQPLRARNPLHGRVSGILGITAFVMLLMLYPLVLLVSGLFSGNTAVVLIVWFGIVLVAFVGSIIGLVFAAKARLKDGWAVTGLVTSIISLLLSLAASVLGLLEL